MEEERIVPLCSTYKPLHRANDVVFGRIRALVIRIIGEEDDVGWVVAEALCSLLLVVIEVDDGPQMKRWTLWASLMHPSSWLSEPM